MVFVDLTKAFDSVSREGLWKILAKAGCPPRLVNIIRSFHDGMVGRVVDQGSLSALFEVGKGTKQDCVMAPLLFSIVFSAMLHDAFKDCDKGVMIRFRSDGGFFNLNVFRARPKRPLCSSEICCMRMIVLLSPTLLKMLSSLLITFKELAADMALPSALRRLKSYTSQAWTTTMLPVYQCWRKRTEIC